MLCRGSSCLDPDATAGADRDGLPIRIREKRCAQSDHLDLPLVDDITPRHRGERVRGANPFRFPIPARIVWWWASRRSHRSSAEANRTAESWPPAVCPHSAPYTHRAPRRADGAGLSDVEDVNDLIASAQRVGVDRCWGRGGDCELDDAGTEELHGLLVETESESVEPIGLSSVNINGGTGAVQLLPRTSARCASETFCVKSWRDCVRSCRRASLPVPVRVLAALNIS